jgi:hypothetical protein
MRDIPISKSMGGYAYQHVTDWLNDYDGQKEKVFKQISAGFAYTGIMIFSGLETVARAVYALCLKGFAQFYDEAKKREFTRKYVAPASENFLMCASVAGGAAISLKENVVKINCDEVRGQIVDGNATVDRVSMFFIETFPNQLRALGFPIP